MNKILLIIIGLNITLFADFSRSANGVVTDSNTNLEWQDNYLNKEIAILDWTEAINYCEILSLEGGGWRLPNISELNSIVDSVEATSLDQIFQKHGDHGYWSSTSAYYANTDLDYKYAWTIRFTSNIKYESSAKYFSNHARCVRIK